MRHGADLLLCRLLELAVDEALALIERLDERVDTIQNVVIGSVADHPYPSLTKNYHHEVELVAALKSGGTNIPPEQALEHVYGYALGLDMTRRDLQNGMAAEKKPWEIGKSFDHAAVIGPIHPATKTGHFSKGKISLAVNGTVRQDSNLDKMIWSVAEQIAKLSEAFELKAGDIIYSGTPENVSPVVKGDVLLCKLDPDRVIGNGSCDWFSPSANPDRQGSCR